MNGFKSIMALMLISCAAYAGGSGRQASAAAQTLADRPVRQAQDRPNILFIAVDDLRPELGCYGAKQILSPRIDQLAGEGLLFERAYSQMAVCMPSRASIMSGCYPTQNNMFQRKAMFEHMPNVLSLNQYFMNNGYETVNIGKIYHHESDNTVGWTRDFCHIDGPWDEKGYREKKTPGRYGLPYENADVDDSGYETAALADKAIEEFRNIGDKPLFVALGIRKPHLPFNSPKKYWDLYDPADIRLSRFPAPPENAAKEGYADWAELRNYLGIPKEGPVTDEKMIRNLIHGYYACVTYVDAQIGRVLDELDRLGLRDNTIVVLWADHGWKLGDYDMWCKHSNYEIDTRVPLLVRAPGMEAAGKRTFAPVELLDLYPTLCDLAGLKKPPHLQGNSFAPLLDTADMPWKDAAFSIWVQKSNAVSLSGPIGYSMRSGDWRYTEWRDMNTDELVARELYDQREGSLVTRNEADNPENALLLQRLSGRLKGWRQEYGWKSGEAVPASPPSAAAPNTSRLVAGSPTGLVYSVYANEGQTHAVHTVPDFSGAGYRKCEAPIPFVPAAVTVKNGWGDDTKRIQKAIDTVSALPAGPDGFRGAVLLKAGEYEVSEPLTVSASGVVIRGEGSQKEGGTKITYTARKKSNLFEVGRGKGSPVEIDGTRRRIADAVVPVGTTGLTVEDASGFAPGDPIIIRSTVNQKWIDDISDMSRWGWTPAEYQLEFRRVIKAVDGNRISIDLPIVQAIEEQYGGGCVFQYRYDGELENIGVECLRLESVYDGEEDEDHGWVAVNVNRLKNGWVRQVTALHFGTGLVHIGGSSQQITVEDCAMLDHKSQIRGGRRYSFAINGAQSVLVQRCLARDGRHDYVSGARVPGPNVFVDCRADKTHSDIGPHHRYSTGQLYDNIMGGQIRVQNRKNSGSGHGWSGAQILFWNCDAPDQLVCDAPVGAMNWCIGSTGNRTDGYWAPEEPDGIWESYGTPVTPRSLFYAQLTDRLGAAALSRIILPQQKAGRIWEQLGAWGGDGLFGDALLVRADEQTVPSGVAKAMPDKTVGKPLKLRGMVRSLPMLDRGISAAWSKLSGPGSVSFADSAALETAATFSRPGAYVLELSADDGKTQVSACLTVEVL